MFFTSDRVVHGKTTGQYDEPEWAPLLELTPDHIDEFMWMRAFVYLWSGEECEEDPGYREVDPRRMLKEVLRRRTE